MFSQLTNSEDCLSLQGKICMITGASSGVGKAAAIQLARRGATVILVSRDILRGKAVVDEIGRDSDDHHTDLMTADLSSQAEIRQLADEFCNKYPALHILINNAGIAVRNRSLSPDGMELTFAVNHLAYFLLTHLLLDRLKAGAPARVINVSSQAHRNVKLDFENLQGEKQFTGFGAYSLTKLCNVLFTYELARRLEGTGVTANAIHPGFLNTGIFREASPLLRFLVSVSAGNATRGGRAVAQIATAPELEFVTGKYFNGARERASSSASYDLNLATQLWKTSAQMTGIGWTNARTGIDRRKYINTRNRALQAWIRNFWKSYYADNPETDRRKVDDRRAS